MLKMLTAYTREVDDIETAVAEILEQLDLQNNLLPNALGILLCHNEFVNSGVVKALCGRLPFEVVGCTAAGISVNGEIGHMLLSLAVITADDVRFGTALSARLTQTQAEPLEKTYRQALEKLPEQAQPRLLLAFMPLIKRVGGEVIIRILDGITAGRVPVFGALASDDSLGHEETLVIYNGQSYRDVVCMTLISGNFAPRFVIASIPPEKIQKQKAIVTESEANVVNRVNDMTFADYLATLGLAGAGGVDPMPAIPVIVDYNDGTRPLARAIYEITAGGGAVCGGDMPMDAVLAIGSMDSGDVLATAKTVVHELLAGDDVHGVLMFPCVSRAYALGFDPAAEMETVRELMDGAAPYQMGYACGEMCPLYLPDGGTVNRFHNFTLIACAF